MRARHITYLLCSVIMVPLCAIIPPIRLGELQELRKKIDAGALTATQVQELFQKLVGPLSAQDRSDSAVTNILRAAERKNIVLSLTVDGKKTVLTQQLQALGTKVPQVQPSAGGEKKPGTEISEKQKKPQADIPLPQEIALATLLQEDIAFLTVLGNELNQERIALKQQKLLLDPKAIKAIVPKAQIVKRDIEAVAHQYSNNSDVETAAAQAHRDLVGSLYDIIQESMAQAAQIKDDALLRKLVRSYCHVLEIFPVYSEKRLKKIEEAELKKRLLSLLSSIVADDYYKKADPNEIDTRMAPIVENQALLDDDLNRGIDKILHYLNITIDHRAELNAMDPIIAEGTALLAQKNPDLQKMHRTIMKLEAAEDDCHIIAKTQKELKGQWLIPHLETRLKQITDITQKLESLEERLHQEATAREEQEAREQQGLKEIEELSKQFAPLEAYQGDNAFKVKETPLEHQSIVTRPALRSKPYLESPAAKKIEEEARKREQEKKEEQKEKEILRELNR